MMSNPSIERCAERVPDSTWQTSHTSFLRKLVTAPAFARCALFIALLVCALVSACSSWTTASPVNRADVVAELTAQANRWNQAIVRKDRQAIEANMAEDFRRIDGQGNVQTKRSFVEGLLSPDLSINPYTLEDLDVRVYGEVALFSGRTRVTGQFRGKAFSMHYRYIDIYVRQAGGWKIVSVQASQMPK